MELGFLIIFQFLFWISFLAIVHTYVLYPLSMSRLGARLQTGKETSQSDLAELPEVNVIMAMYNEASVIEATLRSIVESDYPEDKLRIWIGSDNSQDGSDEIVRSLAKEHSNINLKVFAGRNGKINIVNELIEALPENDGSVLILCDANVVWSTDVVRRLSGHFVDDKIGIVASCVVDSAKNSNGIAAEEESYVNLENLVKFAEGALWGRMMGAFGACYALRRSVYEPIPANFNVDDFYQTMACYEQGFKGIVDLEAICFEAVSEDISEEYRRKRRISKGNFQNLQRFSVFLLPWKCGLATFYAFWSHKGFRWFGPLCLIFVFLTSLCLSLSGQLLYLAALCGMMATFGFAAFDLLSEKGSLKRLRVFKFIRYFYTMNRALLMGGIDFCKGVSNSVWEPTKRVPLPQTQAVKKGS